MATTITHKITPRFKWFPQCEVRPLVEAIMKKFTIKDGVHKYSAEKITQTQNTNTPKSHNHTIEIILKRIQKTGIQTLLLLLGYNDGWSLLFFFHRHKASFSFSLATLYYQEERK
jgi:CRISPR/Cas system CSM-associated protein Csm5 (group 7 of RAMP superfamily)